MTDNFLIEKRADYANKLEMVKEQRQQEIDAQVEAFKKNLEQQPCPQIDKLAAIIIAIDNVIAIEADETVTASIAAPVAQTTHQTTQSQPVQARPGMASIFSPQR